MLENLMVPEINHSNFTWNSLGDIKKGRGELGEELPVLVYRLMQYTMLDVLTKEFGENKANDLFRSSGYLAGVEFAKNVLDIKSDLSTFMAELQKKLRELKIGILRIESFDESSGEIMLTIEDDLDCSGLPVTNETVCSYDEGFIAGIFEVYTGKKYFVSEINCWSNGARICRFHGKRL